MIILKYFKIKTGQLLFNFTVKCQLVYTYMYICTMLEITVGHFPTNFNIWLTKIHFCQPILLYIFNGMAINNLQNVQSSKNSWPISDPYFYCCMYSNVVAQRGRVCLIYICTMPKGVQYPKASAYISDKSHHVVCYITNIFPTLC